MRSPLLVLLPILACFVFLVSACGYTLRGQENSTATHSVLGDGSRTLKFLEVEQPTVHTNLTYAIRSQLRDEINARRLAVWKDGGAADFGMTVRVDSFHISAYGQSRERNLLFTASIGMELVIHDGRTNNVAWRSGIISYSERYANVNEEAALREVLQSAISRGVDRLQQQF